MEANSTYNNNRKYINASMIGAQIDGFENHLVLIDPLKKPSDENKEKIEEFCKKIGGVA